ncbi:two pore potassium channel protein sup-9 [Macrosteles quadrilineatus]|uniref:two pore potassium channel protein sup-9 n=1 Tax=Macrosteles quadrilineatus TaxID=74068 RepID=UPI0023E33283|nr:two pore potassium channel protein sup-9 [Macrosteles quadrilineatus]
MRRGLPGSVRSRGSSTSTVASDPREKLQDCCRKLVAFMCTQVGVGGLIVGYAVVGAIAFMHIEGDKDVPETDKVNSTRYRIALRLWELTTDENVFNESAWSMRANEILKDFQGNVAEAVKKGYDTRNVNERWSFPAALMFSLSVFTMLGYGNMVPRTSWGKLVTVVYAVFGIPLYALYFMNMGNVLAQVFRWVYTKVYIYSVEDRHKRMEGDMSQGPRIVVPSTACLWVMGAYIATGSFMFSAWEDWTYLDSTYFCVTSLCKIGFGDFVPGANISESKSGNQTKLVINFVYILLGMGLMAMCYNLMRELVRVKMRDFKENIGICFEVIRLRAVACYRRRRSLDY